VGIMTTLPIYQNYKFYYHIYLDDIDFKFTFKWNIIANTFLFSMYKDEDIIFLNTALVPNVDFLKVSGIGELGKLILLDTQDASQAEPQVIEDFKSRFLLIYSNKEELNEQ